jgi:glycosyltransferase involved in cell wall biosynthesis
VPAYQVGPTIYDGLQLLKDTLDELDRRYEVIVVIDGSTDATAAEVARHAPQVQSISYSQNRGKGFALRQGLSRASGELVAYIDADMELHPDGIGRLIALLGDEYDAALGSKRHPASRVVYPALRRIQSAVYQGLVRAVFGLNVTDTQTGLKVLRGDVLRQALPLLDRDGFAFDLELLVVLRQLGARLVEGPIQLDYAFNTTTDLRAAGAVLRDTASIWLQHGGRRPRGQQAQRYVQRVRRRRRGRRSDG